MAMNGLANRRLQPLGHSSIEADMPVAGASGSGSVKRIQGHPALDVDARSNAKRPA